MNIHYRPATERDIPVLAHLRWEFDREDYATPPVAPYARFVEVCETFLRRGLLQGEWTCWLAEDAGEIVAHIFVYRIHSLPRPGRLEDSYGYVTNVYTRPAYRNQGIGTVLMQHTLAWAKSQELALLIVSPSERSIPFYRRAGFQDKSEFMQITLRDEEAPAADTC